MHGNMHVRFGGGLTRCPGQPGSSLPTLHCLTIDNIEKADIPERETVFVPSKKNGCVQESSGPYGAQDKCRLGKKFP